MKQIRWRAGFLAAFLFQPGCIIVIRNPPDALDADRSETLITDGSQFDASTHDATIGDIAIRDVQPDYLRPPPITRNQTESTLSLQRTSCNFHSGAWPAETLGTELPINNDIPIDHVLVLSMENRSFDHYYSHLNAYAHRTDVEVAPDDYTNPDVGGTPVARAHDTVYCFDDTNHEWAGAHTEWNNGLNDGFVQVNNPGGSRALLFETEDDIPFYYSLASTFAIADHYFSSLLGPTFPNRYYLMAATSFGLTTNVPLASDTRTTPANQIFARLDAAGVDWRDYAPDIRSLQTFVYYGNLRAETRTHLVRLDRLMTDLQSGDLPPFGFIEPNFTGTGGDRYDEHPPGTPMAGERWVESIVRALIASPAWAHTALFITYDENGGLADHVAPPPACPPDATEPVDGNNAPLAGHFDRYGFRVPFIVVSPYARPHFVSHTVYDHTSILRFVEARFGLPAMTARDANATPPLDMFDFTKAALLTPPVLTPSRTDPAIMDIRTRCNAAYPTATGQ